MPQISRFLYICVGSLRTADGAVNRVQLYVFIRANMAAAAGLILPGDGIVIAGKLYSGVALTLENCLLPPESVHCSPSRAHGLSARTEEQLRIRMCETIQNAGVLLRLPQVRAVLCCLATTSHPDSLL